MNALLYSRYVHALMPATIPAIIPIGRPNIKPTTKYLPVRSQASEKEPLLRTSPVGEWRSAVYEFPRTP